MSPAPASPFHVRRAGPGDRDDIVRVHLASWRETYAELLPRAMVDGLMEKELTATWGTRLEADSGQAVFSAEDPALGIIGFSSAAPSSEPDFPDHGMLDTLYLLPDAQGRGAGRALLEAAAGELALQDYARMLVVVLETNPAVQFYENMGGDVIQRRTRLHRGHMCPELVLAWPLPLGASST